MGHGGGVHRSTWGREVYMGEHGAWGMYGCVGVYMDVHVELCI